MLSSLWLALAAAAAAETATPETPAMDVITVEASKRPLATTEITTRVTVIDAERIQRELAQNIDDLVRFEPGVDVVDQGSRFGLSGFSIRGIGGNRVRTEIDGVATSDAFSIGSFSNASRDFVDVESIKQLEIIRGPASAVFGSNAIGGVVSYITKGPEDYLDGNDSHLDANAGFNSVDESTVAGVTGALRMGGITSMLRVNVRDGGERDFPGADPLSAESVNILGKINFGDALNGGLALTLDLFDAQNQTDVISLERTQDFTESFGSPLHHRYHRRCRRRPTATNARERRPGMAGRKTRHGLPALACVLAGQQNHAGHVRSPRILHRGPARPGRTQSLVPLRTGTDRFRA